MDFSKLTKEEKANLKFLLEQKKRKLEKKNLTEEKRKLEKPTTKESEMKLAKGLETNLQDSLNLIPQYPEFTPLELKKKIAKQKAEEKKALKFENWIKTADESDLMKRYEKLSERIALQKALRKNDPSELNPPQLILWNQLQAIINKIGGTTPSTTTSGGTTGGGGKSIVQRKSQRSTETITERQKTNAQTSLAINMRKSGLYTPQEASELKAKFILALKNKTPVKLRHLPPTDPNSSKTGIYSGFGDPFDINNWEIQ